YPKETMGYYFYFPPENKVIVARYGNFLERDLISQKFSGRYNDLEDDHMDTLPSENTSEIQDIFSRYQQNPGKLHWVAVKHILNYLRNTRDMFLVYGGKPDTELDVICFCDASWKCDKDDTKSQTGYVFVVNGGAVDWKSKKQTTIAMHSAQAEYVAASEAAMEALIKVHTDDNLADPFTKALPRGMVIDHAKGIGLQLASSFMHTCD
nr:retrotransposon protein, putative, Ty1-copia subclass [Tanacetum cinerariifolium]